jgi:hypothetical protein
LDFEVATLAQSIENIANGEIFDTEIVRAGGSGLEKQKSYHSSRPDSP